MKAKWKKFCEGWLADEPDVLTVLEVKRITGYCKTSVQGWIDRGTDCCCSNEKVKQDSKVIAFKVYGK